jgi:hypothetical protein
MSRVSARDSCYTANQDFGDYHAQLFAFGQYGANGDGGKARDANDKKEVNDNFAHRNLDASKSAAQSIGKKIKFDGAGQRQF